MIFILLQLLLIIWVLWAIPFALLWLIFRIICLIIFGYASYKLGRMSILGEMQDDIKILKNYLKLFEGKLKSHEDVNPQITSVEKAVHDFVKNSNCASCKYRKQGPNCNFCSHPDQDDNTLVNYVYWNFSCHLYTSANE